MSSQDKIVVAIVAKTVRQFMTFTHWFCNYTLRRNPDAFEEIMEAKKLLEKLEIQIADMENHDEL